MMALAQNGGETLLHLAGEMLTPTLEGGLWWPSERTLIVSDLHLEKGSAYAAGGQMLPPYDTGVTLSTVEALCEAFAPDRVISLGDSFHDRSAELRLPQEYAARIQALTVAHEWIWVEGNHDPDPPRHLGGRAEKVLEIGPITLRHEPTGASHEIAGHLHPAARIAGRGRSVRRRCFATDGERLTMPAMGAFTGGLNVLDPAFAEVFPTPPMAIVLGSDRVYPVSGDKLLPDRRRRADWRL